MKKYIIPIILCLTLSSCSSVWKDEIDEAERLCVGFGGVLKITPISHPGWVGDVTCTDGTIFKEHHIKVK